MPSFYGAVRLCGLMDDTLMNQCIKSVIVPLYLNMSCAFCHPRTGKLIQGPVILMLAAGPGRIVSNKVILQKREKLDERGLFILMGLPNATSLQQTTDALYSPFKSATFAQGNKVVQAKLKARGLARRNAEQQQSTVLLMDFSDLATIVNGAPDNNAEANGPIDLQLTKEKILSSLATIGFVPFTRKHCLTNPKKVRRELGQHTRNKHLEALQFDYDVLIDDVKNIVFNPGILNSPTMPSAVHVERVSTAEALVEQLLKSCEAFYASGQWNMCDSRIGNAGVTLMAQKAAGIE